MIFTLVGLGNAKRHYKEQWEILSEHALGTAMISLG